MSSHPSKECAWLCLRFTHLGLNSAGVGPQSTQTAAIIDQQRIWECSAALLQSGIQTGMSSNHALMLNPTITLIERDPEQETRKLTELSYWAYRFTSQVSVYNDCTLLLEIGRSIKLFNGLNQLFNLINHDLESFGIEAKCGFAKTPKAA